MENVFYELKTKNGDASTSKKGFRQSAHPEGVHKES